MLTIVASARETGLEPFLNALRAAGCEVLTAASGEAALKLAERDAPRLVILDEELPDCEPFALVKALLSRNAMINTAVLTSLPPEEFHERSEGLGLLPGLPARPDAADAVRCVECLRRVL